VEVMEGARIVTQTLQEECPFKDQDVEAIEIQAESPSSDGISPQGNNSGELGSNLEQGLGDGTPGTYSEVWTKGEMSRQPKIDTARTGRRIRMSVQGRTAAILWPYTVAAHHLIPGNASLKGSQLDRRYMTKGGKTNLRGQSVTIKENIGYNINGAHNGVWLPGNYALTAGALKEIVGVAQKWSRYSRSNEGWAADYIAGSCKVAGGMFHDTHSTYSRAVRAWLNKIATMLDHHLSACEVCAENSKEGSIPPPYQIKTRLYGVSTFLRMRTQAHPSRWSRNLVTFSPRWIEAIFGANRVGARAEFLRSYKRASPSEVNERE